MRAARFTVLVLAMAGSMLAGCSRNSDPELMNIRSADSTPDEFTILPNNAIEIPEDLAALPAPTPGGANRVDPNPEADVAIALGGDIARASGSGHGALISQASRFGVSADIRQVLAAEDLEFRRRNDGRLLERVFNTNVYFRAYGPVSYTHLTLPTIYSV